MKYTNMKALGLIPDLLKVRVVVLAGRYIDFQSDRVYMQQWEKIIVLCLNATISVEE